METIENVHAYHKGRKIERVRKLKGFTQTDLGKKLGISKQAISKLEQTENISNEKLKEIADALDVTFEGLRDFNEDRVINNTINFYENCGVNTTNILTNIKNINSPVEELIEVFERQLREIRDLINNLKQEK